MPSTNPLGLFLIASLTTLALNSSTLKAEDQQLDNTGSASMQSRKLASTQNEPFVTATTHQVRHVFSGRRQAVEVKARLEPAADRDDLNGDRKQWKIELTTVLSDELNDTGVTPLSEEQIARAIREGHSSSRFDFLTQSILIALFVGLIVFGAAGNGLVCYVVIANPHMRSPRNVLILNLAASDLILCCFTQPFNLMKVSMLTWNLGVLLCKLVPMMAGTNVFVSTITITAIALDRFQLIVHPTEKDLLTVRPGATALAIGSIWLLSVLLASPLLVFSIIRTEEFTPGVALFEVCVENPSLGFVKATYSVGSALLQYVAPILIVSIAHAQICNKLRVRMSNRPTSYQAPACSRSPELLPAAAHCSLTPRGSSVSTATSGGLTLANRADGGGEKTPEVTSQQRSSLKVPREKLSFRRKAGDETSCSTTALDSKKDVLPSNGAASSVALATASSTYQAQKRRQEASRKRKTNRLLWAIAVMFALSWLPLNVCNIVIDIDHTLLTLLRDHSPLVFAVCHLLVLCSACANPVFYGWLNANFRREFVAVLCPRATSDSDSTAMTSSSFCRRSSCCRSVQTSGGDMVVMEIVGSRENPSQRLQPLVITARKSTPRSSPIASRPGITVALTTTAPDSTCTSPHLGSPLHSRQGL